MRRKVYEQLQYDYIGKTSEQVLKEFDTHKYNMRRNGWTVKDQGFVQSYERHGKFLYTVTFHRQCNDDN